jgi:hypothetical protein
VTVSNRGEGNGVNVVNIVNVGNERHRSNVGMIILSDESSPCGAHVAAAFCSFGGVNRIVGNMLDHFLMEWRSSDTIDSSSAR